jgi:hypothetical protein
LVDKLTIMILQQSRNVMRIIGCRRPTIAYVSRSIGNLAIGLFNKISKKQQPVNRKTLGMTCSYYDSKHYQW